MKTAIVAIMLAVVTGAWGDVIELPLNCAGTYDINTSAWTYNFDLGVTFSEVSHVYIDWSGGITGGTAIYLNGSPNPVPVNGTLEAYIDMPLQTVWISGGAVTYPNPEPFDVQSAFRLGFNGNWNNLLDGQGNITINYPQPMTIPEVFPVDYGSAVLNDATLVVEGTVVPEPSTFVLLGFGLAQIIRRKHYSRNPITR